MSTFRLPLIYLDIVSCNSSQIFKWNWFWCCQTYFFFFENHCKNMILPQILLNTTSGGFIDIQNCLTVKERSRNTLCWIQELCTSQYVQYSAHLKNQISSLTKPKRETLSSILKQRYIYFLTNDLKWPLSILNKFW